MGTRTDAPMDVTSEADDKLARVTARIEALRRASGVKTIKRGDDAPISCGGASPGCSTVEREIEQLRAARARRVVGPTPISGLLDQLDRQAAKQHRRLGNLVALWESLVPEHLVDRTGLGALRGGNLHVHAENSAVAFELDRLLRSGLLARLRREYGGALSRVKIEVKKSPPVER